MTDFLFVSFTNALDKCIYRLIFYDADRTAAKSAACDTGTDHARDLPCKVYKDVDLLAGNLIVITQRDVRLVHELTELCQVTVL